jgi:hypothetical protein
MSSNDRIYNVTRGYSMRGKQALRAVDNCAMAWVEVGRSVRDLTLRESIAARSKQASDREPLPMAEIPGIMDTLSTAQSRLLVYEASLFVSEVA